MNRLLRLTIGICLAASPLLAQPQTAPTPAAPQAPPSITTSTRDVDNPNALKLSLDEAIRTAAEKNLGVSINRYDVQMSAAGVEGAYAPFDMFTNATLQTESQKQPVSADYLSSQTKQTVANFGLQQMLVTGGTYSLGFNNARQSSNSRFTTVNPAYSSDLNLGFTQPLLRNFGTDINRTGIYIARNTLGINEQAFRATLMDTTLEVEQAYYDLIYARQNLVVQEQSLTLGRDQARITQIRIDVGAAAPLDILQPNVAIATREESVITAEALVLAAEDRLRQLMNLDPGEWNRPIVPTDEIGFKPMTIDVDAAVAQANQNRPEIKQAELGINSREVQYQYARNQVLPRLDLGMNYGFAGLGGTTIVRDPVTGEPIGTDESGWNDASSQVFGADFPSWSVGVNFGLPIFNIGAKAEAKRAELDVASAKTSDAQLRQNIAVDVRSSVRNVDTLAKQITATRAAREAAEKNLDAERKRFENGMSTNFEVLQIQQDLSDAWSREIQALVLYNRAVAAYHRSVGDLLEFHDITVNEPATFTEKPSMFDSMKWLTYSNYSNPDSSDTKK